MEKISFGTMNWVRGSEEGGRERGWGAGHGGGTTGNDSGDADAYSDGRGIPNLKN